MGKILTNDWFMRCVECNRTITSRDDEQYLGAVDFNGLPLCNDCGLAEEIKSSLLKKMGYSVLF